MAAASRRDIILHVYNLSDDQGSGNWLRRVGLGAYHSGVEIGGAEYTFGPMAGVFFHLPKNPSMAPGQQVILKESIVMGTHVGSANEIHGVINRLRDEFKPSAYHPVNKNCNHFSDALCQALVYKSIPSYVNRPANIASTFSFGGGSTSSPKKTNQSKKKVEKSAIMKKELTEEQKIRLEKIRNCTK